MTEEEKQLLIKDICARLPYGVFVKESDVNDRVIYTYDYHPHIETCKPYLRPMSSMTEEEKDEYEMLRVYPEFKTNNTDLTDMYDFLNSHYLDYRGLIPMGLALKAPEGMYKV